MGRTTCAACTACTAFTACAACAACAVFTACALWFLPKGFFPIGTHANLVGLICRQLLSRNRFRSCPIFIDQNGIAADGHRHIDGSFACINIIAEAGVFPGFLSALRFLLINLYGIAAHTIHFIPACSHDLIAYRGQCDACRCIWLVIVCIRNWCFKLLTVDGSKRGYCLTTLHSRLFLCHKDGGDIIVSARRVRTVCRYVNCRYCGIAAARIRCYFLLVYQVGRFALFRAQVGAQGILYVWFRVLDLTAEDFVACSALCHLQLFKWRNVLLLISKVQCSRTDVIACACACGWQTQQDNAVLRRATDFRNEVACSIDLTCLCRSILLPSPNRLYIVYGEAVLNHFLCNIRDIRTKIKQDIRCFLRTGIDLNRLTALALRQAQNDGLQRSVFLLDDFSNRCFGLQRHE